MHGWGSRSIKAWREFDSLLLGHVAARGTDVVFYGYEGVLAHPTASADVLWRFLGAIATDAGNVALSPVPRTAQRYDKILIVAHSMGAIVARRALLFALKKRASWAKRVELILFAPAHSGVEATKLALELPGFFQKAAVVFRLFAPATNALHDDETFTSLAKDVTKALATTPKPKCLVAKTVVVGSQDAIVTISKRFCEDPFSPDDDYHVVQGKGHVSVCKPHAQYTTPLDIVVAAL